MIGSSTQQITEVCYRWKHSTIKILAVIFQVFKLELNILIYLVLGLNYCLTESVPPPLFLLAVYFRPHLSEYISDPLVTRAVGGCCKVFGISIIKTKLSERYILLETGKVCVSSVLVFSKFSLVCSLLKAAGEVNEG